MIEHNFYGTLPNASHDQESSMYQWIRPVIVAAAIACVGLATVGCSESVEPTKVASEVDAEIRVKDATKAASPTVTPETQARIDAYTADALASLKRSADFLAAQNHISFQADVAYNVLQANGQMLEFGGTRDFLMRRPDRLRVESIHRDGGITQLFFDGESILIDMPVEDAYIQIDKPGTYYAAMDYLVDDLGAPAPLEDFISINFAKDAEKRIKSGFYVQRVMLDDHICEQLAWRTEKVDVQLWVREGEEPVPCRVVIIYKNAKGRPQFAADFHDWNFSPDVDDDMFRFVPPESAERLQAQAYVRELRNEMGAN